MDIEKVAITNQQSLAFLTQLNCAAIGLNSENNIIFINEIAKSLFALTNEFLPLDVEQLLPSFYKLLTLNENEKVPSGFIYTQGLTNNAESIKIKLSITHLSTSKKIAEDDIVMILLIDDLIQTDLNGPYVQQSAQLEGVSHYASGIAHDFNNVLNIISGHLEILQMQKLYDPIVSKRLKSALKGVDRGKTITERLSRMSQWQQEEVEACHLTQLVQDNFDLLTESVSQKIKINLHLSNNLDWIKLDASYFIDTLINLCVNAGDAIKGAGNISIKTFNCLASELFLDCNEQDQPWVGISITDDGIGISDDIKNKIFEPFFTTKEKHKGTGLGLSLVYNFVNNNNGLIKVDSEIGQGSCFSLYFPAIAKMATYSNKDIFVDIEQKLEGKRVLVVDDELPILNLLSEFLGIYGLSVNTARSGFEGLNAATEQDYDLILSDLIMPGELDGADFVCQLLKLKPNSTVIFMSGYTDNKLLNRSGLEQIPIISKPFRKKELLSQMGMVLA